MFRVIKYGSASKSLNLGDNKILVVDDEEDILELVRYNLAREGYRIVCAASGICSIISLYAVCCLILYPS